MKTTFLTKLMILGGIAFFTSCSPKTVEPVTDSNETVEVAMTAADITNAKTVFETNCQKCHALKVIDDYSQEKWNKVLPSMAKKANLTASDTELLARYIHQELQN